MSYLFCFKCFKFYNVMTGRHLHNNSNNCDDPEVKP